MNRQPRLVAHADWSTSPGKRWLARAVLGAHGQYVARPPEPVGDAGTLLGRLLAATGGEGPVFVGFDYPIGLPAAYAERAALDDFLAALPRFGEREWADFYHVATCPGEIALRRPFYPQRPGGTSRAHLVTGLGLIAPEKLLRACDRAHENRRAANAGALRAWARSAGILLAPGLVAAIEDGFGTSAHGEDQFDAVVGLLGMLNVLLGGRPPGEPVDERVRRVEGWILRQAISRGMAPFRDPPDHDA